MSFVSKTKSNRKAPSGLRNKKYKTTMWGHRLWLHLFISLCIYSTFGKNVNREYYRYLAKIIDNSVNTCSDFYLHACGNWQFEHTGPEYAETLSYIDYKSNMQLMSILRRLQTTKHRPEAVELENRYLNYNFVQQLLYFYQTCTAVRGYEPSKYFLWMQQFERVAWPSLLRNARRGRIRTQYDWVQLLAQLRKYEMNGIFIDELVLESQQNPKTMRIDIDRPVVRGGFAALSAQDWHTITAPLKLQNRAMAMAQLWHSVQKFEQQLQELIETSALYEQSNLVTFADLQPNWLQQYLSQLLVGKDLSNVTITISNLEYLYNLEELLQTKDDEFIASYLQLRFLWHLQQHNPIAFSKLECTAQMRIYMPPAMDWLFEQEKPNLYKETMHIEYIFAELKAKFHAVLQQQMHKFPTETGSILFEKLHKMALKVNNLPRHNTSQLLELYYANLSLNALDYYSNHLNMLKFRFDKMHAQLFKPAPSSADDFYYEENVDTHISSSPYYISRANIVIVPLTLLQRPIYQPDLHALYKYSALGFLLAHELLHGFDESSLRLTKRNHTHSLLEDILQSDVIDRNLNCLYREHADVIDEKIADINGLQLAFHTYFDGLGRANDTLAALGIASEYSKEQLFFLNFAQFFCGKTSNDDQLDFHGHGTDHQRVNDALANFNAFGKAYACRRGSQMRPKEKCRFWR